MRLISLVTVIAFASCGAARAPGPRVEINGDPVRAPAAPTPDQIRQAILDEARSSIGMREATGRNDGPDIERWLRLTGASKGDPWCAAFNYGMGVDAGFPIYPKSAWSPTHVTGGWVIKNHPERRIAPASAFGIWFASKGRIAHTGLVEKDGGASVTTIEGNTNGAGSRDGDGVYRKFRLRSQVHSARDWVPQ